MTMVTVSCFREMTLWTICRAWGGTLAVAGLELEAEVLGGAALAMAVIRGGYSWRLVTPGPWEN
jgi:hypothetical protein